MSEKPTTYDPVRQAVDAANPSATALVDEIYRIRIVRDAAGNEHELVGEIDPVEGDYLRRLISADVSITRTLEVGCAFGLSSLHICEALRNRPNASHTIIDPMQNDRWQGVGVAQLERAGIDFFNLIAEPSELALPELLREGVEPFDFVFIDGWHTFDHTMLDMFYANRLVRVGGYVAVDDCNWPAVAAAVSHLANYPAYERVRDPALPTVGPRQRMAKIARSAFPAALAVKLLPAGLYGRFYRRIRFPSVVVFRKVAEDTRSWTWFESF